MTRQNYPLPIEMLARWAHERPDHIYLSQPVNREYKTFTWAEVYDQVLRLAAGLRALGLRQGDKISILGKNTAEWFICDFAAQAAGLISVPIYFTASENIISTILEHSEAKAIFVGKMDSLDAAKAALADKQLITIAQPYDTLPCDQDMNALIADHGVLQDVFLPELDAPFSYSYTSGSTGTPKGAVLSYRNIAYGAVNATADMGLTSKDRLISYLPLAHMTERALIEHMSLYKGTQVSFVESMDTFVEDLRHASPSLFLSVPRLWMKFQAGVLAKMPQKKLNLLLKIPILKGIVQKKIKTQLGLHTARLCGSGTAPIAPAILQWYRSIGVNISEGWGMTELSGLAISNFPYRADKIGSIGVPISGTEMKISEQGEILIKSDGVFKHYYKEPEKTAETIIDGWVHTGDKGSLDSDGYVTITGRVKDIFKTGKGKYCVPVPIESLLIANQFVEQICVMGTGLPQPVAMVNLSLEVTASVDDKVIEESLAQTLKQTNMVLEAHEKVDRLFITKEQWSTENALLTSTLKIKRSELEAKYAHLLTDNYDKAVVWE